MNVSTHALVGAAVGSVVPLLAAVPAGAFSHVVCDMLPHRDYSTPIAAGIDLSVACVLVGLVWYGGGGWGPVLAAVSAVVPDIEVAMYHVKRGKSRLWFPSHNGMVRHGRGRGWSGWMWPVMVGLGAVLVLVIRGGG